MIRFFITLILFCTNLLFSNNLAELAQLAGEKSQVAVSLKSIANNKTILGFNDQKLLIPASNLKLLSLAAVLDELSPEFKFQTKIFWDGSELRIKGSGDPAISDRYYAKKFHIFKTILTKLKLLNITEIDMISADSSLFIEPLSPPDWELADKTYYFAPEISALSFNDNCIDLVTNGVKTHWFPFNTNFVQVINQQKLIAANKNYDEKIEKNKNCFTLKSSIPVNSKHTEYLAITDPARFTIHSLRTLLMENGITCKDLKVHKKVPDYTGFKEIFIHNSPPLTILLKTAACNSNNFFTEMLTLSAAAHNYKTSGSYLNSLKFVNKFLTTLKLPEQEITDNCGLSRTNRISADFFTTFLIKMNRLKCRDNFTKMLPLCGTDHMLHYLPKSLNGQIHAKTGSMKGVYCLSGYINKTHTFSILINNSQQSRNELKSITSKILLYLHNLSCRKQN